MQGLVSATVSEDIIRTLWLRAILAHIKSIFVSLKETNLENLAIVAVKILEGHQW